MAFRRTAANLVAASVLACVASCSAPEQENASSTETKYEITSPILYSNDKDERSSQEQSIIQSMLADDNISLEDVVSEADRRGVKLTPQQVERKRNSLTK